MFPISIISNTNILPAAPDLKSVAVSNDSGNTSTIQYTNGDLFAMGYNNVGKLGSGDTTIKTQWYKVMDNVRLYTVGDSTTIVITNDDKVFFSGRAPAIAGNYSSLPTTTNVFYEMTEIFKRFNINRIKQIHARTTYSNSTFIIDESDQLWGIGSNQSYALGSGTFAGSTDWVMLASNVKSVHLTQYCTWILKYDGTVYRTGTNNNATVIGSSSNSYSLTTFTQYSDLGLIQDISTSPDTVMFLLSDGTVRLVGIGSNGQIGNGTTATYQYTPYNPGLTGVTAVKKSSGGSFGNILVQGGTIKSTGAAGGGRGGRGNLDQVTVFTPGNTGELLKHVISNVHDVIMGTSVSYYIYEGELYGAGTGYLVGSTSGNSSVWVKVPTPYSSNI